jgi:hypothetical protein
MSFESPGPEPPSPIDGWSNSVGLIPGNSSTATVSFRRRDVRDGIAVSRLAPSRPRPAATQVSQPRSAGGLSR